MRVQGGDFSSEKSSGETCPDLSNQRSGNYLCTGNGFSVSSTSISKSGTTYGVDHPPLPRKLQEFPTCPAGGGVASIWSAAEDSRYGDGSRRHVEAGRPAVSAPRADKRKTAGSSRVSGLQENYYVLLILRQCQIDPNSLLPSLLHSA